MCRNSFDIDDRKGLEILILTALLTFQDTNEAYHTPGQTLPTTEANTPKPGFFNLTRRVSENVAVNNSVPTSTPPTLPPKPAPKSGVDRIAEMHAVQAARGEGEANEVLVGQEGSIAEYAEYAERLLRVRIFPRPIHHKPQANLNTYLLWIQDDAMLFVTIKSASAAQVPIVLQVVEHTKRLRHQAGQSVFLVLLYSGCSTIEPNATTRSRSGSGAISVCHLRYS